MPNLRVATYNIRHGLGLDGKMDLDRVGRVIADLEVDLIGLQEVDKGWRRSGYVDQARYLAQQLGLNYVFAPALSRRSAQYGNAVLSRYPITFWEAFPLPSLREPRVLVRAVIQVAGRRLNFYTTHLGLNQRERLKHINEVVLPAISLSRRSILTGDFNCLPDSPEMTRLTQVLEDACPPADQYTYPSQDPSERIDFVMYAGVWDAVESQVHPADASDHNPVLTVFDWS
ncbi:MAG: endonuclease/exonuclease/phosphatase family protein [Syntrophomonadales bacterium]|jgi:endonuclease/exonuclease/phosphatase family metal-dependent hydrolase